MNDELEDQDVKRDVLRAIYLAMEIDNVQQRIRRLQQEKSEYVKQHKGILSNLYDSAPVAVMHDGNLWVTGRDHTDRSATLQKIKLLSSEEGES